MTKTRSLNHRRQGKNPKNPELRGAGISISKTPRHDRRAKGGKNT